jgi:hypothetical protein
MNGAQLSMARADSSGLMSGPPACYFDDAIEAPKIIRLHFVREEILAA